MRKHKNSFISFKFAHCIGQRTTAQGEESEANPASQERRAYEQIIKYRWSSQVHFIYLICWQMTTFSIDELMLAVEVGRQVEVPDPPSREALKQSLLQNRTRYRTFSKF